jgi:hypothetical protein
MIRPVSGEAWLQTADSATVGKVVPRLLTAHEPP